ncbi:hypothetical protein SPHINGO361_100419 [Sphingomonas sp. EC-HK361]|nr:hypothetical protein SPHINGO361_100419 [Sphingomonas sp. EC-HK361]
MKSRNAAVPLIQPLIPAARKQPHSARLVLNPPTPSRIIARRPWRSDRLAQIGAAMTHKSADTENAAATALSGTASDRPSAGSTDCSAVLPAAIVSITTNSSAKLRSSAGGRMCKAFIRLAASLARPGACRSPASWLPAYALCRAVQGPGATFGACVSFGNRATEASLSQPTQDDVRRCPVRSPPPPAAARARDPRACRARGASSSRGS